MDTIEHKQGHEQDFNQDGRLVYRTVNESEEPMFLSRSFIRVNSCAFVVSPLYRHR